MTQEHNDLPSSINKSLVPVEAKESVLELTQRIKEIVRSVIILDINGMRGRTDIEMTLPFGTTYEEKFVKKVSQGEVSLAEILAVPNTPLTGALPDVLTQMVGRGPGVLPELLPTNWSELLSLNPNQLAKLFDLQEKEEERMKRDKGVATKQGEEYFNGIAELGIPKHNAFYPINWGVLRDVLLMDGSEKKVYKWSSGLLSRSGKSTSERMTELGFVIATEIPHLFYQATFEGNKETGRGGVMQKLIVLAYHPVVIGGWSEWFTKLKDAL